MQFSVGITAWRELDSRSYPTKRAELNSMLIAQANLRVDAKRNTQ